MRRSSCEHSDSRRVVTTDSGRTVRDQQLHRTRRCSCCHAVRCASHSTRANEMGDHTKTRFKSESSFGRLRIHLSSARSITHCITNGVFLTGRITGHASVQNRCKDGHFAWCQLVEPSKLSVRADGSTTCEVGKSRERHDKSRMENLVV